MIKSILTTAALTFILITAATTVHAQYGCSGQYGQYGGCPPSQSIMINKTVGKVVSTGTNSTTLQYVDNLSPDDPRFKASQDIYFQLKVKNTSSTVENNIKVVDYIPSYLNPIEGPGAYDANARTITFFIDSLNPGQENTYTVHMQVKPLDQLNAINDNICEANRSAAWAGSAYDEDTAQFCVEKAAPSVTGVTQVPSTGPTEWVGVLVASLTSLALGIYLKRKYN